VRARRRIVMWSFRALPSFRMRGRQVGAVLARRGHQVEFRNGFGFLSLRDVRDSIVVLVKDQPSRLSALARRGNRVIFDAVDFQADGHELGPVDAIVCASQHIRTRLAARLPGARLEVIYHHADPRLELHRAGSQGLRLVYSGETHNSRFLRGQIPELKVVPFRQRDWPALMRQFNAHFSARLDPAKAVVKLANAAALGAVFLTGAEPGCVELLGADYPFFLRHPTDLTAVRQDVDRLREAIGSPLWNQAREQIIGLRSRLSLEATAGAYERLLDDL
jgi:hypothetical protein